MKKFFILLSAAILGSSITIVAFNFFSLNSDNVVEIQHVPESKFSNASYSSGKVVSALPSFTQVAKDVMPAVVHIKSTHLNKQRYPQHRNQHNPFGGLFDDDILNYFFSPRSRHRQVQPRQKRRMAPSSVAAGSGVIINSEGYIVTNNHVIEGADDIEIALNDNRIYKAKLIGVDFATDLALLKIDEKELSYVPLVDSDKVQVGEWVLAVGNPFNLNSTVTAGIVSAKARNINIVHSERAIESFIQTDAAINPGNSGGALVDLNGGLVGINTAIASNTGSYTGYGFAVPSNIVNKVVKDLIKYGQVQRGYLGLMIRDVDGNLAREKKLDLTQGVYVADISASSAAGEAGVKIGDVIEKINGVKVEKTSKLLELVGQHNPGDKILLSIDRKGDKKNIFVNLRSQNGRSSISSKSSSVVLNKLGVELQELSKKKLKELNLNNGLRVKNLYNGVLKQDTDMREGFIITKINDKPIYKISDFVKALKNKKGGVLIEGMYENYSGLCYYAFGL